MKDYCYALVWDPEEQDLREVIFDSEDMRRYGYIDDAADVWDITKGRRDFDLYDYLKHTQNVRGNVYVCFENPGEYDTVVKKAYRMSEFTKNMFNMLAFIGGRLQNDRLVKSFESVTSINGPVFGFIHFEHGIVPAVYDGNDLFVLAPNGKKDIGGKWSDYNWVEIISNPSGYIGIKGLVDETQINDLSKIKWCTKPVPVKEVSIEFAEEIMEMWFQKSN
jgi:hypothetical protein